LSLKQPLVCEYTDVFIVNLAVVRLGDIGIGLGHRRNTLRWTDADIINVQLAAAAHLRIVPIAHAQIDLFDARQVHTAEPLQVNVPCLPAGYLQGRRIGMRSHPDLGGTIFQSQIQRFRIIVRLAMEPKAQALHIVSGPVLCGGKLERGLGVAGLAARSGVVVLIRHRLGTAVNDGLLGIRETQVADRRAGPVACRSGHATIRVGRVAPAIFPFVEDPVAEIIVLFKVVHDEAVGGGKAPDDAFPEINAVDLINSPVVGSAPGQWRFGGHIAGRIKILLTSIDTHRGRRGIDHRIGIGAEVHIVLRSALSRRPAKRSRLLDIHCPVSRAGTSGPQRKRQGTWWNRLPAHRGSGPVQLSHRTTAPFVPPHFNGMCLFASKIKRRAAVPRVAVVRPVVNNQLAV